MPTDTVALTLYHRSSFLHQMETITEICNLSNIEDKRMWSNQPQLIYLHCILTTKAQKNCRRGERTIVRNRWLGSLLGDSDREVAPMNSQQCSCLNNISIATTLVDMPTWKGEISHGPTSRQTAKATRWEAVSFWGSHIGGLIPSEHSWTHAHQRKSKWTQGVLYTFCTYKQKKWQIFNQSDNTIL